MSATNASPVQAAPSPVANTSAAMQPRTKLALAGLVVAGVSSAMFLPGGRGGDAGTKSADDAQPAGGVGQRFQPFDPAAAPGPKPDPASVNGLAMPGSGAASAVRLRRVAPASIVGYQAPADASVRAGAGTASAARGAGRPAAGDEADAAPASVNAAGGAGASGRGKGVTLAGMRVLRAERLPQPQYWLMPGDKLSCDQNEPIVGVEGAPFTCVLSADVKGRTGGVTLLYKGARLVGTVVRGLDTGEERAAVAFNHAEDAIRPGEPDPIVVPLDSPGADVAGQAGLDGHVKTFFWQKLGATAAYALLDLATQGASAGVGAAVGGALGGRTGSVNVLNLGSQGRSLAQSEFGEQANRKPQFTRDKGEPLTVFITHPIDFRDVVAVRLKGGAR